MNVRLMATAFLAAGVMGIPGIALAQASRLQVIIGGEAYDGPPRFEVTFDGSVLGQGVVDAAIDTATTGRFAETEDKTAYVQSFEFAIPEEVFHPGGEVRVRLLNEAYGGEGSDRDRNLYLAAIAVNGGAVTVSGLATATPEGFKPNELVGEFLMLKDGNEEGLSPAPRGGWPAPPAVVAVLEKREPRLAPTVESADAGDEFMPVPGIASIRAPETGVSGNSGVQQLTRPEPVETASIPQVPAGGQPASSTCGLDQVYNVIGFNENSNDLTPRLMARLDQIITDIGNEKCNVQVTGYSSVQGSHATNALFAVERAQNVLRYMREKGLQYERASATGAGATTQFGPEFSANRRVVITVAP